MLLLPDALTKVLSSAKLPKCTPSCERCKHRTFLYANEDTAAPCETCARNPWRPSPAYPPGSREIPKDLFAAELENYRN